MIGCILEFYSRFQTIILSFWIHDFVNIYTIKYDTQKLRSNNNTITL